MFIRKIDQYDKQGNFIKRWDSMKAASKALGILPSCLTKCASGITKTAGKFV